LTSTTLTAPSSSLYGQNVALTATVSPIASGGAAATGLVQFTDVFGTQTLVLGTARLHNGTATLNVGNLQVGTAGNSITAQYLGNATYPEAQDPPSAAVTVTVSLAPTITVLSSSPSPVSPTGQVTLFAQVLPDYNLSTGGPDIIASPLASLLRGIFVPGGGGGQSNGERPTGTVTFTYTGASGPVTETVPLGNNGRAQLVVNASALQTGTTISASYSGDGNYESSDSQSIQPSVSSTLLPVRLSLKPSGGVTVNTATTFSITVRPHESSTATTGPSGTVSLYDATTRTWYDATTGTWSATNTSPVTLTAGATGTSPATGSFSAAFATAGLNLIIATYSGDANFAGEEVIIPIDVRGGSGSGGGYGFGGGGGDFGFGGDGFDDGRFGRRGRG
jgi:hypothetical protein